MTLKEATQEIESHEFVARVNVASDFRTFLRAVAEQKVIHVLSQELAASENRQYVLNRVLELSRRKVDLRYENPWDTALTAYVWLLNVKDWDLAKIAAEAAARAPQCWWATKMAHHILLEGPVCNDAGFAQHEFMAPPSTAIVACASGAEEVILLADLLPAKDQSVVYKWHTGLSHSNPPISPVIQRWLEELPTYTAIAA